MVATINLATNSQKLLTQPWPCAACHAPRKSILLFLFKCWQLCYCIAANHSDFGRILPLFTQYSAIPIGITKFRQNLKISVMLIPWTCPDYACARRASAKYISMFCFIMLLPAYTYF